MPTTDTSGPPLDKLPQRSVFEMLCEQLADLRRGDLPPDGQKLDFALQLVRAVQFSGNPAKDGNLAGVIVRHLDDLTKFILNHLHFAQRLNDPSSTLRADLASQLTAVHQIRMLLMDGYVEPALMEAADRK